MSVSAIRRHWRMTVALAVGLVVIVLGAGVAVSQSRDEAAPSAPPFSGLDNVKADPGTVGPQVRSTLDRIGVDANADTSVVRQGGLTVTVVRTPKHYYFALDHGDGTPAALAETPVANLDKNAGTAVLAGTANTVSAAVLVPDGVSSVTVTDSDGSHADVPVVDNIAAVERKGFFSIAFEYQGETFEPIEIPKRPADSPGGKR